MKFQSTLPRGERLHSSGCEDLVFFISIHAPARGATLLNPYRSARTTNFNPRSREGSDRPHPCSRTFHFYFNPRSREGSDQFPFGFLTEVHDFNPRSREGSDGSFFCFGCEAKDFNPRSREGSDKLRSIPPELHSNFNPRSREGSDLRNTADFMDPGNFNPRSREGSDSKIAHIRNIFSGNYVNLVKICKCESTSIFLFTDNSHQLITTEPVHRLLQFRVLHLYFQLLLYIYFLNSKTLNYLLLDQ